MRAFIFILAFVTLLVVADRPDCEQYLADWKNQCCNGGMNKTCRDLEIKIIVNECNIDVSEICTGSPVAPEESRNCKSYKKKWAKNCCHGETTKKCKRWIKKIFGEPCNSNIIISEVCHHLSI